MFLGTRCRDHSQSSKTSQADSNLFLWKGYTKSYVKVQSQSKKPLFNQITPQNLHVLEDGLYGNLLE